MRLGHVAAALLLAACGGGKKVHRPGDEWLRSVVFEGNHAFDRDALLTGLALHRAEQAGRAPDPYVVQLDTQRLRGQYLRAGYFGADVQSRIERAGDAATVIFTIQEGPRATTRVVIEGLPRDAALPVATVRQQLPLAEGAPFDYDVYDKAKVGLLDVVEDAGYAHAKLDATVHGDVATHTATIRLVYTPGPKCTFGDVTIQGVDGDLRQAIEDRLQFHRGTIYSHRAITATQRSLYAMQRFSTVQVQPDAGTSPVVDVKIAVAESASKQLALGGGFGIDPISYEVRGRVGYSITGWPGPLETLTLELRPAYAYLRDGTGYQPRMRALARVDRLDLWLTRAVGSVEGGYTYLAYEAYTEFGPEARLAYDVPVLGRKLHLYAGWLFERYDFRNINPLLDPALRMQIGIDQPERVGAFTQSVIADLRDHPLEPGRGIYAELRVAEGTAAAGGAFTYLQIIPELRGYLPVERVILAARARYGAFWGEVPPTERFFAGGATSNRGFSERQLSPSVTGPYMGSTVTVPYGGGGLIDTSVEARVPITTVRGMLVGAVAFLDGGDVTETASELSLARLCWAIGGGVRVHTPVGPVRADAAYRLNRKGPTDPEPLSTWAFHISLGEAF